MRSPYDQLTRTMIITFSQKAIQAFRYSAKEGGNR